MTLAAAPAGPQVVTVFNDRGPPLFQIAADNSTVTHQRGFSGVGWATSANGSTWSYKGKVATPAGWAALLGDPTIATNPTDDTVVYIATLALSTPGWNTQFGAGTNSVTSPLVPEPDGFCVARSIDGGNTFPASGCVQFQTDVDKTALTVDGTGRIWVAMEDKLAATVRIWRSDGNGTPLSPDWDVFVPITPECDSDGDPFCTDPDDPLAYLEDSEPRLETDLGGDPWLFTVDSNAPLNARLLTLSWDATSGFNNAWFDFTNECGVVDLFSGASINVLMGAPGQLFRNAFRYDFGVGLTNQSRDGALRVAYEVEPLQSRHIRVAELSADIATPSQCAQVIGWQTDIASPSSTHFQASVSYQFRGQAAGGFQNPEWWLGYLTNDGVIDPSDNYVRVSMVPLNVLANPPAPLVPILWPPDVHTPSDYYACPRSTGYWGDYFGIAQVNPAGSSTVTGWRTVMTFPDSRPAPPCEANTNVVGKPMQVAAASAIVSQ